MRRRAFLIGSAATAGGLVLGYRAWANSYDQAALRQVQGEGEHLLAGWVKIGSDDTVTVYVPHIDMGQGTHTALAMLLAEELDADWSKVRTARAPGEKTFANQFLARGWILQDRKFPVVDGAVGMAFAEISRVINLQITGGSTAVRMTGRFGMRQVGATARAMLIAAAADRWNVPAASLAVRDGMISDPGSDRSARFGELAQAAARLSAPVDVPLKQPRHWRIVGTSLPRLDIPAKTDGSFAYGIDLKLPDMLHAAVTSAPVHGGRLTDVDLSPAQSMPSVALALRLERGVAVVATSWWQARRALEVLEPQFSTGDAKVLNKADLQAEQDRVLDFSDGSQVLSAGDPDGAISSAAEGRVIEATYRVPYLHQAAMEPINVTAQFSAGKLSVWGGEQDALGTKVRLMELSGLGGDAIVFHGLAAGGAFGRRTPPSADYLEHLVPIAFAVAPRPVKLILAREEEFAQGAYRPALATKLRAALGADGRPVSPGRKISWLDRRATTRFPSPTKFPASRCDPSTSPPISAPALGGPSPTRSMPSGRRASSTNWRMRRGRTRSNTATRCFPSARASEKCWRPQPKKPAGDRRCRLASVAASPPPKATARSSPRLSDSILAGERRAARPPSRGRLPSIAERSCIPTQRAVRSRARSSWG